MELRTLEPWWKLILGNKALLPLLWSMYPNHEHLLPAFYDEPSKGIKPEQVKWVSKPLFGREGLGVFTSYNSSSYSEFVKETEKVFGKDNKGNKLG